MKDQNFSIKISDLLNQTGRVDEITFDGKFLPELTNLTADGISWNFFLQSLSDSALLGELKDLHCSVDDVCDSCQKAFKRDIDIPEYSSNFVIEKYNKKDEDDDEEFPIDAKNEVIDIHDMVLQAIVLKEPIVKRCATCQKKLDQEALDDEDDFDESLSWSLGSNIIFS